MTKKEYEKIDWEVEQAQIRLDIAIYLLKELGSSFEDKKIADTLDDLSDSIRWQRNDLSKEQERNEALHQQIGVDGWQEEAADAPSKEQIDQELSEELEKEKADSV